MVDVTLVRPASGSSAYGPLGEDGLTAIEPPPWTRMIAGYLIDCGVDVSVADADAYGWSASEAAQRVSLTPSPLVAIVVEGHQPSASTQIMPEAGALAREIKRENPRQRIAMLGNHPSALPERTLDEEAIDFVIDGEGHVALYDLLRCLDRPEQYGEVAGLVWREPMTTAPREFIRRNDPAPLSADLDQELHGDVWNRLPMERYRAHNWQVLGQSDERRRPYASIYTSLGCPYRCSFCMINAQFHTHRYRTFSPDFIVDQIDRLYHGRGVRTLKIADEMFVLNPKHYLSIVDGLAARGLGNLLNIWAYARVDTVRSDNLARLRAGGVRWLALGIESADAQIRDGAEKHLRRDDIVDVVRTIQNAGINVIGNFMFGLPGDTIETMRATLDLARGCQVDFANFYSTMAYPGSALHAEATREGWALPSSWAGYSQHGYECHPLDTKYVSGADVLRLRDTAFRLFYSDAEYHRRIEAKFGSASSIEVERMTRRRLPRRLLGD